MKKLTNAILLSTVLSTALWAAPSFAAGEANEGNGEAARAAPTDTVEIGRAKPISPPKLEGDEASRAAPITDEAKAVESFTVLTRSANGEQSRSAPSEELRAIIIDSLKPEGEQKKDDKKLEKAEDPALKEGEEANRQVFGPDDRVQIKNTKVYPFTTIGYIEAKTAKGEFGSCSGALIGPRTVLTAVAKHAKPADIVQPGHIFPLMAQNGGVLVRAGHTEAGCDLAQLAGLTPASVICEILKDDGTMARLPDLVEFAREHGLKIGTIADLIHYRSRTESLVKREYERALVTAHGEFRAVAYVDSTTRETHLALVRGDLSGDEPVLVRVHEPLSVVDALDAGERSHSWNLHDALATIAAADRGVIVLLHRTETGTDLLDRLRASAGGTARRKWDLRTYGIGAQILRDLGVARMRLMAQPLRMPSMAGFDLEVAGYLEPGVQPGATND